MKKLLPALIALFVTGTTLCQNVGISHDGSIPDPSAMLEIKSTDSGLLIPRLSSAEKTLIGSPAEGLLVYDTDTQSFWYYNAGWQEINSGSDDQSLSLVGQTLSIEDGNSVIIPTPFVIQDGDEDTKVMADLGGDEDHITLFLGDAINPKFRFNNNRLEFLDDNNIRIGLDAGAQLTSGTLNTYIGKESGETNSTGNYNTHIGYQSGRNAQGSSNTFIGAEAGEFTSTGSSNTIVGDFAGHNLDTGNNNILVGANAGSAVTNGSGNIIVGTNAGPGSDVSNQLYIDNAGGGSPLIFGDFSSDEVQINGSLGVLGNYTFPQVDGISGQSLTTDGAGNVSWSHSSVSDDQTLSIVGEEISIENGNTITLPTHAIIEDGDGDTGIKVDDGADNDEVEIFIDDGFSPSYRFTDQKVEFLSGSHLFLGMNAGGTASNGSNTVIGQDAGEFMTGGSFNTFLGRLAGQNNSGTSNTFIGTQAGQDNTTGGSNTILGDYSAHNLTEGSSNTVLGVNAGNSLNLGSGNVLVGANVNPGSDVSNRLYVNNGGGDNPLVYGEFDNDYLQINGELNVDGAYSFPLDNGDPGEVLHTDGTGGTFWADAAGGGGTQTLSISGDDLSISAGNTVSLAGVGVFQQNSNLVSPASGQAFDDFVFGSTSLDYTGSVTTLNRFQFDKSKAAFRAGHAGLTQWNSSNVGDYSFAAGQDNIASGMWSAAMGDNNLAETTASFCFGTNLISEASHCVAIGRFNLGGGGIIWTNNDPIFEVGTGTSSINRKNALTVLKGGKVIIGATSTDYSAFGSGYQLVVDGKMLCEEVRVQDSGSWPDYVFDEDHERLSFAELRTYLQTENHLPGVPSAQEVNGNGYELGMMNEVLLEKIEELYLYVLELEEQVQTLQSK